MRQTTLASMALVVTSAVAAGAQSPIGCYRADRPLGTVGTDTTTLPLAGSAGRDVAQTFQLLDDGRVDRPGLNRRSWWRHGSEWTAAGDSLRVRLSTMTSGWMLRLARAPGRAPGVAYTGEATYLSDVVVVPPGTWRPPRVAVRVVRESCALDDSPANAPSVAASTRAAAAADAGIDALNARLMDVYRRRDPHAYAELYTDTAVFEWPAFDTVHGRAALAAMARDNWAAERDVELRLRVAARRYASDHATEFGAFEQSWRDSAGVHRTEFGRYVSLVVRQPDGRWLLDRFFGFEDSTRVVSPR